MDAKKIIFPVVAGGVALSGIAGAVILLNSNKEESNNTNEDNNKVLNNYNDGEYSAEGEYQSPNGNEKIVISVVLKDSKIDDVFVETEADNPTSQQYQDRFAGGIEKEVVGKHIDNVSVSRVNGSSLTPKGFEVALNEIKLEALKTQ